MNLENLGVQEMSTVETKSIDGGSKLGDAIRAVAHWVNRVIDDLSA